MNQESNVYLQNRAIHEGMATRSREISITVPRGRNWKSAKATRLQVTKSGKKDKKCQWHGEPQLPDVQEIALF